MTTLLVWVAFSHEIERSEEENELPDKKWLIQLIQPGSSLGGARPKANVIDTDKTLYIAKFPSRNDDYNAGLWEHFCHENLQELYRRVAFNICIGNSDDHFRNHGFLLTPKGWTLSPAYDMNPTLNEYQSLLIDNSTNQADLSILLEACENYMINKDTANKIIAEVITATKEWKILATKLGIANREMDMFGAIFNNRNDLQIR